MIEDFFLPFLIFMNKHYLKDYKSLPNLCDTDVWSVGNTIVA